ncbi:iron ABC transporter permease [Massilia sp. H6]|uniref:ABC transporter permease n=1 Tax=Massilia sp. H6 TaxID=2970464 RepID=UPI00216A3B5E|nr:iron ABC transporter permease [Massilia sp. H6]UVW29278.1 iron ABC transporter permease [Massilia sp. H6]
MSNKSGWSFLTVQAFTVALLIALPIFSIVGSLLVGGTNEVWRHLVDTVLTEYVATTLMLCLGVSVGVILVGVPTAWLVSMTDFPGRRLFEWALILPLAVPAYVMAYTYTDLLQFVGPVQTWMREGLGIKPSQFRLPDIRTSGGALLMFIFVFYPYVYLLARAAFLERASSMVEVGRSLGLGPWRSFYRISLPMARPAIVAGTSLALMETLADYGAVSYFGVQTFTTGIYRAWFSFGDRVAAAQLSAVLLAFVAVVVVLERFSRGRARFHVTGAQRRNTPPQRLHGLRALGAVLVCALPLTLGLLIPVGTLLHMSFTGGDAQFGARFVQLGRNSFVLALGTAVAAVAISLLLAYAVRASRHLLPRVVTRIVGLGYALPGSVIAVGVLIPVTRLDTWLGVAIAELTGRHPGLLLTGGIAALVYAYLVRFLTVSLQAVEAGLTKVKPSMDDAARSLGYGHGATLWKIHLPLVRGSLLTAGLLVFVDVMKELPATLVMRPFNFDTLATQAYMLASDERLIEAATPALTIVAVGLLPLLLISRQIARDRHSK